MAMLVTGCCSMRTSCRRTSPSPAQARRTICSSPSRVRAIPLLVHDYFQRALQRYGIDLFEFANGTVLTFIDIAAITMGPPTATT